MKKFSLLLLVIVLFACKKNKNGEDEQTIHGCTSTVSIAPYLVGKWKLISWKAAHDNTFDCSPLGGNTYNCDDWGTNAMIEIFPGGTIKTYKNDVLINESLCTKQIVLSINNYGMRYDLACGETSIIFINNNPSIDSLQNLQLGDTLKIANPYLDINFFNEPIYSITTEQKYVKIE